MNLTTLLLSIQQKKTVNFAQVIKKLPSTIHWQSLFSAELVAKNKHLVSILDAEAFETLLHHSQLAITRSQAASHLYESSHSVNCDSAYLLCFPVPTSILGKQMIDRDLTVAAVSQNKMLPLPFAKYAKHAILIENQDCFFQWQTLLSHFAQSIDLAHSDIYFSAGSRVLNPAFAELLSAYNSINCVFDYDLAGLQMTKVLTQRQYAPVRFLIPDTLNQYQSLFTFKPRSTKDIVTMIAICKQMALGELATIVAKQKCFMEQEALLTID